MKVDIRQGDCLELLKTLEDNSVDSIVTDPPAGIAFLGKDWDKDKGGRDNWIKWMESIASECNRVLKPGGHAFVWTLPRTSHWTTTAWENAGFEIRDVVAHVFGQGMSKGLNVGKSVDKLQGNEREVVGKYLAPDGKERGGVANNPMDIANYQKGDRSEHNLTKGNSEWEGWGTALKPAREDWILMRKSLEKGLNIAQNCLKWGVGGINIDASRIDFDEANNLGRFPSNFIHDGSDEVKEYFPNNSEIYFKSIIYQPKASKKEKNEGCGGLEAKNNMRVNAPRESEEKKTSNKMSNLHPTPKSIALMDYLIKMITPKGGTVLDPFLGSGTTGCSAVLNGYSFIGFELSEEYIQIAKARIEHYKKDTLNKLI